MSDSNDPLSEKSQKRKGTVAGASGAGVHLENGGKTTVNNNHKKVKDQESQKELKDKKVQTEKKEKRRKNQMPSKKRSGGNGFVLSKEDIYYLKTHTRYDEKEIK